MVSALPRLPSVGGGRRVLRTAWLRGASLSGPLCPAHATCTGSLWCCLVGLSARRFQCALAASHVPSSGALFTRDGAGL